MAEGVNPRPLEPTDKPRSSPAATEGVRATEAETSKRVRALLLGPRLRFKATLAAIKVVIVASMHTLRALPPAEQLVVEVWLGMIVGRIGPTVMVPEASRLRPAPIAALGDKTIPLDPIDSPRLAPAVTDGTTARDADASKMVIVLLPTTTPTPALPPMPTEGVTAASTQISSTFPPAEQDTVGNAVVVAEREEPCKPRSTPTVALGDKPIPLDPTESPRSMPTVREGATANDAETSRRVMVLLETTIPTPAFPPTPTEGVIAASIHTLRTLPPAEHVTDGNEALDDKEVIDGMELLVEECKEPDKSGSTPIVALAPIPIPFVPAETPKSPLAATDGATSRDADIATTVIVLLPKPTLMPPPAPTEGVIAVSKQISSTLS